MPFITHFNSDDYSGGIQNWSITQDQRGFIYVANNFGLLEFDGSEWKLYTISNNTKLRSVLAGSNNRIYVGGQSQFGYLAPNETGELKFHSLIDLIPTEYQSFDDVWRIYQTTDGILFGTNQYLFHYANNQITVTPTNVQYNHPNIGGRKIVLTDASKGLIAYEDGNLTPITDETKGLIIKSVLPFTNDNYLLVTYTGEIFNLRKRNVSEWQIPAKPILKESNINTAIILKNGNIAIGTQNNGLIILSKSGEVLEQFNIDKGLNNRTVNCLYEDDFNNLWVGLNDGISYIELGSPFSHLNEDMGLQGIGYAAALKDNNLYLGTSNGLFYATMNGNSNNDKFTLVENSNGHVNNIETVGDHLLMSHHEGPFEIRENQAIRLSDNFGSWKFIQPNYLKDTIVEGTYTGFNYYSSANNQLTYLGHEDSFNESSRVLTQDGQGNIWMTHGYKGAFKLNFLNSKLVLQRFYDHRNGFPSHLLINVFNVQGRLIYGSQHGLYDYHIEQDSFIRNQDLQQILNEFQYIGQLKEDMRGDIYFIGDNRIGVLAKHSNGTFTKEVNLFNKVNHLINDDLQNITCIDLQNVLIGAKSGFIHYNPSITKKIPEYFRTYIRNVSLTNQSDSTIFGGNIGDSSAVQLIPKLSYEFNSLKFKCATPFFDGLTNEYSYMLEGFQDHWSEWTTLDTKEYTNLPEGDYTFKLRSRNIYGKISETTVYSFSISPPWFRSIAAYASYFCVFAGVFVFSLVRLDKKHKRDKAAMEQKQKEALDLKESELTEVTKKSKEEITTLKNEKLHAEIKHKNQELASATMYIINKNEFITEIKNNINNIIKKKNGHSQDLGKIVREIDKNVNEAEDWKQFEVHFDDVHQGFTSKLKGEYPDLTPQEIKLSAYLRMNMTTKEIAHLMHISPRGVEIGRYRLRKKLGLERSTNLVDFMMNY